MSLTSPSLGRRKGQSLIESCLAIVLICLVFAGVFQVSQLFAVKEVLGHSAARGARAKTVGFNYWMVRKATEAAAIPTSGRMITPAYTNEDWTLRTQVETSTPGELWDWVLGTAEPSSIQYGIEMARIPEFLESANDATAYNVLDYDDWDGISYTMSTIGTSPGEVLHATVRQEYPLWVPMHRSFYDADSIDLEGDSYLEKHYSLYLDDMFW